MFACALIDQRAAEKAVDRAAEVHISASDEHLSRASSAAELQMQNLRARTVCRSARTVPHGGQPDASRRPGKDGRERRCAPHQPIPHDPSHHRLNDCRSAEFRLSAGHAAIQAGSCAGVLSSTAPSLTVHRGQHLSVQIMHEQDGRLDFPIPTAATAAITIAAQSDASVTYQAVSTGTVVLLAHHTQFVRCPTRKSRAAPF
jgi:hypothetical protein